jgi:hypothetical protein
MKKALFETMLTLIEGNTTAEAQEVREAITAELNKGAEEKAAKAAAYAGIHDVIVDNLTDTPISCGDLWGEIEGEVIAKGMSRGQVQWALNNLWEDEIEKIPGKPNTYRRK